MPSANALLQDGSAGDSDPRRASSASVHHTSSELGAQSAERETGLNWTGSATIANVRAERQQREAALVFVAVVALATVALMPLADEVLPPFPGFVPLYQTALIIAYGMSSVVLFTQFRRNRSLPLLLIAGGCLYTGAIVLLQLLTFPGLFGPGRLIGTGPETTIWLWTFWHLGPPIYGLAYAAAVHEDRLPVLRPEQVWWFAWLTGACAIGLAVACTYVASAWWTYLPTLIDGDDFSKLTSSGVGPFVQALTILALVALWRTTRGGRTVLELWLLVSLALLVFDNFITFAGGARATVGWYAGRIEALLSATAILAAYLYQLDILQARAEETAAARARDKAELEAARDSLAVALEAAEMGHWNLDLTTGQASRSLRHDQIFGYDALQPVWTKPIFLRHLVAEDRAKAEACFAVASETGTLAFECRIKHPDESVHRIAVLGRVIRLASGEPVRLTGVVTDLTERHRTEEQLRRAQRMESIGLVVGGVAHDFNNLLTAVVGNLDIILRKPEDPTRVKRLANNALTAAQRGARLTKQLLTFASKQQLKPETLNPNSVLLAMEPLARRAAGDTVDIDFDLHPALHPVHADPAEFEAALLNLLVNAREATSAGGRITIQSKNVVLDASPLGNSSARPGAYALVAVSDTGIGMDETTRARAFEPFFTTKNVGSGTGLGLSQVYGFAGSAGGFVEIESELGRGTTVRIYLPHSTKLAAPAPRTAALPLRAAANGETVLVVEDDPDVLGTAVESLKDLGYSVLVASNAHEAVAILDGEQRVDLMFSDVVMPGGMNGVQLSVEARRIRPMLKVLLTSGYTGAAGDEVQGLGAPEPILSKPYGRDELASRLQLVLRGPERASGREAGGPRSGLGALKPVPRS